MSDASNTDRNMPSGEISRRAEWGDRHCQSIVQGSAPRCVLVAGHDDPCRFETAIHDEVAALRAERDELRKATQDALAFASVLQQQLGWARSKSPELSRELEQQERDAYRLFDTCWDALKMKPEATRAT